MQDKLPTGFTLRAPTPDDAQAVTDLIIACDIDELGRPEYALPDLLVQWRRKNFDLAQDARVVLAPDGTIAAYTDLHYAGGLVRLNNVSCVNPIYKNHGIEEWILQNAEEWARRHVTDYPVVIRHVVNAGQPAKLERMERAGYHPVRQAWIMQILLNQPPPEPIVPDGIIVRPFERGRDEHAAWMCIQETFRDLWQHTDVPYDEWASFIFEHAAWSPELSFLAFDGDEIAGAAITMNDSLGGWVQQVGVRRPWRKRGVGLALLNTVFHALYKQGVDRAGLEVDAENPSGALRLYQRAGMTVKEHYTEFRKQLAPLPLPALS